MKPLIIANWKCNPRTLPEAKTLFNSVKRGLKNNKKADVVVCPPSVFLGQIQGTNNIKIGGQNCFWEEAGAFTGEISPKQILSLNCQYVILGHSERRKYFQETDEEINKKIRAALKFRLTPIFCVGETKEEREAGELKKVLENQIAKGLEGISKKEIKDIIFAYEPVWAIGAGNGCDIEEAERMKLLIIKIVCQISGIVKIDNLRIVYGGSVDAKNAAMYLKEAGFSGLLVGGASLRPKEFIEIAK